MKTRITIEVDHVESDRITEAEFARGIAWAASKSTPDDGDHGSEEMAHPSRLWLSYRVEVTS